MGTAPTRPGGYRPSLAPVARASGRPQGFFRSALRFPHPHAKPLPIALAPTEQRLCGEGTGGPAPPAAPRATLTFFFPLCSPLHPIPARLSSPSPAASAPAPGRHRAPPSAAPSPPLTEALTQARSGAPRPPGQSRVLPTPPSRPRGPLAPPSSGKLHLCSSFPRDGGPPTAQSCTSRGWGHARGPYRQPPSATANPEGLGECEPCTVSGSTAGGADGGILGAKFERIASSLRRHGAILSRQAGRKKHAFKRHRRKWEEQVSGSGSATAFGAINPSLGAKPLKNPPRSAPPAPVEPRRPCRRCHPLFIGAINFY